MDMDPETAALIERLMLDDMDDLNAAGVIEAPPESRDQAIESWSGGEEDRDVSLEREGREEGNTAGGGWSAQDVSDWGVQDHSETSQIDQQEWGPIDEAISATNSHTGDTQPRTQVVGGIVDPASDGNHSVDPLIKGKGKETAPLEDGEIVASDREIDEDADEDSDRDGSESDVPCDENEEDDSFGSDSSDHHEATRNYPHDYLFEPCTRVWDPSSRKSELHATIPWSFIARTFGIVVNEEDNRDGRRRRRGRKPWEQHSDSAEVIVHEIRLDQLEGT